MLEMCVAHHYVLDLPSQSGTVGTCKNCNQTKVFLGDVDPNKWVRQPRKRAKAVTLKESRTQYYKELAEEIRHIRRELWF